MAEIRKSYQGSLSKHPAIRKKPKNQTDSCPFLMNLIATRLPLHTPRRVPRPCPAPVTVLHARASVRHTPPRAPRPCPVAVGRDVPIAPPRQRRGARLCIPRTMHTPSPAPSGPLARAAAPYARGGSPPRCAALHPAYHAHPVGLPRLCRPHHYTRALPGRRDGDIAPYRHYTRDNRTLCPRPVPRPVARFSITPTHFPRCIARGGSPPRAARCRPPGLPARALPSLHSRQSHDMPAPLRGAPSHDPPLHPRNSRAALPVGAPHPGRRDVGRRASRLAPYRHYTHTFPALHCPRPHPGRRDGDIAPYRHYTRDNRTLCPRPRPVAVRTCRVPLPCPRAQ